VLVPRRLVGAEQFLNGHQWAPDRVWAYLPGFGFHRMRRQTTAIAGDSESGARGTRTPDLLGATRRRSQPIGSRSWLNKARFARSTQCRTGRWMPEYVGGCRRIWALEPSWCPIADETEASHLLLSGKAKPLRRLQRQSPAVLLALLRRSDPTGLQDARTSSRAVVSAGAGSRSILGKGEAQPPAYSETAATAITTREASSPAPSLRHRGRCACKTSERGARCPSEPSPCAACSSHT
jgi:hypothetical protein